MGKLLLKSSRFPISVLLTTVAFQWGCAKAPPESVRWRAEQSESQLPSHFVGITSEQLDRVKRDWSFDPTAKPSAQYEPLEKLGRPNPFDLPTIQTPEYSWPLGRSSWTTMAPTAPPAFGELTAAAKQFLKSKGPDYLLDSSYRSVRVKVFPLRDPEVPPGDPMPVTSDMSWYLLRSESGLVVKDAKTQEVIKAANRIEIYGGRLKLTATGDAHILDIPFRDIEVHALSPSEGTHTSYAGHFPDQRIGRTEFIYQGDFVIKAYPRGGFSVVNYLNVENYLDSVVAAEMPVYFPMEALRAQAISARTYTVRLMIEARVKSGTEWDALPTTKHQCYLGKAKIRPETVEAVTTTAGQILTFNGEPIYAMYHSNSGGRTVPAFEVYQAGQYSYLSAVADAPFVKQKEFGGPWRVKISAAKLKANLVALQTGIQKEDELLEIGSSPYNQSEAMRTWESRVSFRRGNRNLNVLLNRSASSALFARLGFSSRRISNESWESMVNAKVTRPENSPVEANWVRKIQGHTEFEVTGYGNGHGVGLSQWGAYIFGDPKGSYRWTGEQILKKYYLGAEIERMIPVDSQRREFSIKIN